MTPTETEALRTLDAVGLPGRPTSRHVETRTSDSLSTEVVRLRVEVSDRAALRRRVERPCELSGLCVDRRIRD
jgi:hypothetical protein